MIKKGDHNETITAAKEFKNLFCETIFAEIRHGANLTPFESEVFNTSHKLTQALDRLISLFEE